MRRPPAWPAPVCVAALVLSSCITLEPPPRTPRAEVGGTSEASSARALADRRLSRARAHPADHDARLAAGMAAMRAALVGNLDLRDRAEAELLAAHRLAPAGSRQASDTARTLGRFLNMRTSVLDLSRIDLQAELYASVAPKSPESATGAHAFSMHAFHRAAMALQTHARGHTLAAYREVQALERDMRRRFERHPDEVDTAAMAGNYAVTFASVMPVARERRMREAVEYLSIQQQRWDELTPRARATYIAPNVRTIFALNLAEVATAAGDRTTARRTYEKIVGFTGEEDTLPRRRAVSLARHRLDNLDAYLGREELLPPWPAGETACVSCHARESDLSTVGLFTLEGSAPWE